MVVAGGAALLSGCAAEGPALWQSFGLPAPGSDRSEAVGDFWVGSWIAALAVGVVVWGLMGYAGIRYRRRRNATGSDAPRQSRYNLPMEILYTLTPLLVIGVLFVFTVQTQTQVLAGSWSGDQATAQEQETEQTDRVVDVVGQKWQWTFNYRESLSQPGGTDVYEIGTLNSSPDLYLPVGESVRFNLSSPDVIHSFWVPSFYFKMDVIPGKPNSFVMTPSTEGTYIGKCAELCGTYHAAMYFHVHVVSVEEYERHLAELEAAGNVGTRYGSQTYVEPQLAPQGGEAAGEGEGE
nr:cytochrome c oxidase subunit II [Auraticoccus cholistanensis]